MDKSIYKISAEYLDLLYTLEENGGEFTPEIEKALAINQIDIKEKALAYIPVLKSLEMEQKEIKAEIKRLSALKKNRATIVLGMKERLKNALEMYEISEIKTATNSISFRKSEKLIIDDVELLPDDCIIIEKKAISANEIKAMIKKGRFVPGAKIVQCSNIQIK